MFLKFNQLMGWGLGLLLLSAAGYAAAPKPATETKNPLGCKSVGHRYEMTTLNLLPEPSDDSPALFFIYNRLDVPVQLNQMRDENRVDQLNLNHVIPPHLWAVLSTSEKQLRYACTKKNGQQAYGRLIDCESTLKVCEYVRVKYGLNNRGDFWVVNGNTSGGAVQEVIHYGIIPR